MWKMRALPLLFLWNLFTSPTLSNSISFDEDSLSASVIDNANQNQSKSNSTKILVVDLRLLRPIRADAPSLFAIQSCIGLMNRRNDNQDLKNTTRGYAIWRQEDLEWLREIEQLNDPTFTPPQPFIKHCLDNVVKGKYIRYSYPNQQNIVPNIVTLVGVLDALPLVQEQIEELIPGSDGTLVFDAQNELAGYDPHEVTAFVFDRYANLTTAMAKMNPGYKYSKRHALNPPLTKQPFFQSVDLFVHQRLFTYFLIKACVPFTSDHAIMERMVQKDQPNTQQWEQPIIVYGYDDNNFGFSAGDPFEAETNCVKEHNLGQISTHFTPNLSFWAWKPSITEPLNQIPTPTSQYNRSKTYLSVIIGDGDSFFKLTTRNLNWVNKRIRYCQEDSRKQNCFPLSWTINPHTAHIAPDLLRWYYQQAKRTGQDYFLLPPSGYLYAYPAMIQDKEGYALQTSRAARLLNTSGLVDWEFMSTWKTAIHKYFPKLESHSIVRGIFAVNVPFNVPIVEFLSQEFFKKLDDSILFRPREWRSAAGHSSIPFAKKASFTEDEMADEVNSYPLGTCAYIYVTSDGGIGLKNVYNMVSLLEEHVEVVSHEILTDMALRKSSEEKQKYEEYDNQKKTSTGNQEPSEMSVLEETGLRGISRGPQDNVTVIDLRENVQLDPPTEMAIQACVGLFNRNSSIAGSAYVIWRPQDLTWYRELVSKSEIKFTPPHDFLARCLDTVAQGYIHFNYVTQQVTVPNLMTLAGVLDAVPLTSTQDTIALINQTKSSMIFDAEKVFHGFTAYDVTKYMFELYANATTTMSKSDPGYDYKKSGVSPTLTGRPSLKLADYVVKERLFNFFLLEGCIPLTKEHSLLDAMTQHSLPNTPQWPQPIPVFGYDDNSFGQRGDPFEAETLCVKDRNMGQVATSDASNLAFFSRRESISQPLEQNSSPKLVYDEATTYVTLVIGDGDNIGMAKDTRNYKWVQQRSAYCANQSMVANCFPISWTISPHLLTVAPDVLRWYYKRARVTGQDFFLLPPSGYLYAYPSLMGKADQANFVEQTEGMAKLLNSSGTVDWEIGLSWKRAIKNFFPRYVERMIIRGIFSVNVPFNLPVYAFRRHEYYKIIEGGGGSGIVLFRPREWRGTSGKGHDIPWSKKNNLSEEDMAAEISEYPRGTVCYIYLTSDGGADLNALYKMVSLLDDHVVVVNHEVATDLALQRSIGLHKTMADVMEQRIVTSL